MQASAYAFPANAPGYNFSMVMPTLDNPETFRNLAFHLSGDGVVWLSYLQDRCFICSTSLLPSSRPGITRDTTFFYFAGIFGPAFEITAASLARLRILAGFERPHIGLPHLR